MRRDYWWFNRHSGGDPRRLPGSLCDQTPEPAPAAPVAAGKYERATPVPAPTPARDAAPTSREHILTQRLADVTADRDSLDTANGTLVARLRLYRRLLADVGLSPETLAALERAELAPDRTLPLPRVRSMPPPRGQR